MKCVALLAFLAGACASTTVVAPPEPSPAPAEPTPTVGPPLTEAPSTGKCELELSTSLKRRGQVYELTAIAKNISDKPLTFEIPDRCPNGPIAFAGLPVGYDYYRSCTKGACIEPRKPIRISVAARESVELATVDIDPAGANCTRELPSGRYSITFGLESTIRTCAGKFGSFEHTAAIRR